MLRAGVAGGPTAGTVSWLAKGVAVEVAVDQEAAQRRWRAVRGCERMLSGTRPCTVGERLSALGAVDVDLQGPPDTYGDGPVAALEDRVARLLGKPSAAFFPTGTMAQQVALRCWAQQRGNWAVALHPLSHLDVHERRAYAALTGLRPVWLTREQRQPTADDVAGIDEPFGTILLELPLRDAGYLLPTWAELTATVAAARQRGAAVHVDGARLWETTHHFGQQLPAIAELADTVYVSFYKTLGGISGAALAGPAELIATARAWRHRYGGQVFQQWPAVLAAWAGLDRELPRLPEYVAHAAVVAAALARLPGARVHPLPPHTHQFQLWLPGSADALNEAALGLAVDEKTWFCAGWSDAEPTSLGLARTEVTVATPGLGWTADDVVSVGQALLARAGPPPSS